MSMKYIYIFCLFALSNGKKTIKFEKDFQQLLFFSGKHLYQNSRSVCDDKGLVAKLYEVLEKNSDLWKKSTPYYDLILYQAKSLRPLIEQSVCQILNAENEEEFNKIISKFFGIDTFTLQAYEETFFHYLRPINEYRKASKIFNDLLEFLEDNWNTENPLNNYENNKKFLFEMNEKYGSHWISEMDVGGQLFFYKLSELEIEAEDIDSLAKILAGKGWY